MYSFLNADAVRQQGMIRRIEVADYPRLVEIWESAVVNTHDFLKKEDFLYYKKRVPSYFPYVSLFGFEQDDKLVGFIGISGGNMEMLFIDNDYRGKGVGRQLILYAVSELDITKVDVNEQNIQAVGFYEHMGFHVVARSELDNEGKAYPILHMQF